MKSRILLHIFALVILGSFLFWEAYSDYTNSRVDILSEESIPSFFSSSSSPVAKAPIMSKIGNETLKQELGRSSWRLLHVYFYSTNSRMMGKFPKKPTQEEKTALRDFIYLFARLYRNFFH